jgi:predicted MPP superfamily phosphohydrolase
LLSEKKVSQRRSPPDLTGGENFPAMASIPWRPLRLLLLILLPLSASWTAAEDDPTVARSAFPIDGDVAWVVQISDLHISAYHPDRADDLVNLLGPALRAIRPHLLLVTGDITGAPTPPSFHSPISRLMYPSVPE